MAGADLSCQSWCFIQFLKSQNTDETWAYISMSLDKNCRNYIFGKMLFNVWLLTWRGQGYIAAHHQGAVLRHSRRTHIYITVNSMNWQQHWGFGAKILILNFKCPSTHSFPAWPLTTDWVPVFHRLSFFFFFFSNIVSEQEWTSFITSLILSLLHYYKQYITIEAVLCLLGSLPLNYFNSKKKKDPSWCTETLFLLLGEFQHC